MRLLGRISWGKGEEDGNLGEENQDLRIWGGEEYQVVLNFIHPCMFQEMCSTRVYRYFPTILTRTNRGADIGTDLGSETLCRIFIFFVA